MPTRAQVGLSNARSPAEASTEAVSAAVAALGAAPQLAVVFATAGYDQTRLLASVRGALGPGCQVVGCTGEGVIGNAASFENDHAVMVMAIALEGSTADVHLVDSYASDPKGAAHALADQVGRTDDMIGLLLFPDGLGGNCSEFLAVLSARLPGVPIVGGTAGDAMRFERTYQYCNDEVRSGAVAAVALRGSGKLRVGVSHGCAPVGAAQILTKVDGAWLREIDGQPAWDVFKSYLDGDPSDLNADGIVHLCVATSADPTAKHIADPLIIRTPLALDKATGSLLFPGGGLYEGQRVRMSRRDGDRIRKTAATCAEQLVQGQAAKPAFILQFDCAGRGKVMFGSCAAEEIVAPLQQAVGAAVPWGGFHTYGELAETAGRLAYHNYTVALCAFYDP